MAEHITNTTQGMQPGGGEEKFSTFLEEIKEKHTQEVGLLIGEGGIYLAHKSIFDNIQLRDIISMNVAIIDGKGTAEWKLMTPGSVIPQLPVHIHLNDEEREFNIVRLSPWTVILSGGEHLGSDKHERHLNYKKCYDDDIIQMAQNISKKTRTSKFRSMPYGHSESICTDPKALNTETLDAIYNHAFSFITPEDRSNYVLYINGTHLMYVMYSLYCNSPEKNTKHKILMAPQTFTLEVDNQYLATGNGSVEMYMCPLILGSQNIHINKKDDGNVLENGYFEHIQAFNKQFKEYFQYDLEQCKEFPPDPFVSGMFSSLVMEVIPTPFEIGGIKSDFAAIAIESAQVAFGRRLNFIATHILRARGIKAEDVNVMQNDKIAAMYMGAVIQLQLSPTAFRCFRQNVGKEQLGADPLRSNWIPDEQSTINWNIDKYLEQNENENFSTEEIDSVVFRMAHDCTVLNFLAIADRSHIFNCEMFLNNDEWPKWEKLKQTNISASASCTNTTPAEKKKDAVRKKREKCFCEIMKRSSSIPFAELIFLRMNCNIFRYKSSVLFPALYILRDIELEHQKELDGNFCDVCDKSQYDIVNNSFCPCYLFYAACCRVMEPVKGDKIYVDNVCRMKHYYNNNNKPEKFGEYATYKCSHTIPVIDQRGQFSGNGNMRLKHSQPDGFKLDKFLSKASTNIGDTGGKGDDPEQNPFLNTIALSTIIKKVEEFLEPLFTDRYTIHTECPSPIVSSNRIPMIACEDLNISRLIADELIKTEKVLPFLTTDESIPSSTSIPTINQDLKEIIGAHERYDQFKKNSSILFDTNDETDLMETQAKRKHFNANGIDDSGDLFSNASPAKISKCDDNENNEHEMEEFILSVMYSVLVSKKPDNVLKYEDIKKEFNLNHLHKNHLEVLKNICDKYKKQGGHEIFQKCLSLKIKLVDAICNLYFDLLGNALNKTFTSVSHALNMSPLQLDDDYDMISLYNDNSNNYAKSKLKAKMVLDICAPNSIVRKSTTLTYFGNLRHQLDVNVINGFYPDSKSLESRIQGLTQKFSTEAELHQLTTTPGLLHVERMPNGLAPKLVLLNPTNGTPEVNTPFIAPAIGKITAELTEPNYSKATANIDDNTPASEYGYVPSPLLNCDTPHYGIVYPRYDVVSADELLASIRQPYVRMTDLTTPNFMSSQFHDKAVEYGMKYLTKLNRSNHTSNRPILPPLLTNISQDIRRIIGRINLLMDVPVFIYDAFIDKKRETKTQLSDINVKDVIYKILQNDKIKAGFFHLFCVMGELYGDCIGSSHTLQYNVPLERRASWIKTFSRAFMRLTLCTGNSKQLKWKAFKTFIVNNSCTNSRQCFITTLNDVVPPHGSYMLGNMMYTSYSGVEASNVYRTMSVGDPFPSNSIYAHFLDLNTNTCNGKQIILGKQALYKNWTATNSKKTDIDTLINQLHMSSFIDELNSNCISIYDLVDYYQRKNIIPDNINSDNKEFILLECLNIHRAMIQESYEERLYTAQIFPRVWNILNGKDPSGMSDDSEDEDIESSN